MTLYFNVYMNNVVVYIKIKTFAECKNFSPSVGPNWSQSWTLFEGRHEPRNRRNAACIGKRTKEWLAYQEQVPPHHHHHHRCKRGTKTEMGTGRDPAGGQ